jgi:hypothetical protein
MKLSAWRSIPLVYKLSILIAGIPAIQIWSPRGDLLENFSRISPDGLDWILQGRLLGQENLVLPVLRNSGYVLISKADWLLGGHGFVFAISAFIGLYLQLWTLIKLLEQKAVNKTFQILSVLMFAFSYIHFVASYILPDVLAIGIMVYSLYQLAVSVNIDDKAKWIRFSIILLLSCTLQFYAFLPFILAFAIFVARRNKIPTVKFKVFCLSSTLILSILATTEWRRLIRHASVPSQFELLELNLNMLPFYEQVWSILFIPVLVFIVLSHRKLRPTRIEFELVDVLFLAGGTILLFSAFVYQWPESRISYSGFALIYMGLVPTFASRYESLQSYRNSSTKINIVIRVLLSFFILTSALYGPSNPWQPKWNDLKLGYSWVIVAAGDILLKSPSPYVQVVRQLKQKCLKNEDVQTRQAVVDTFSYSDYQRSQLYLYAEYCPKK